jgi:Holliday junction resolvase RusA-like endonuclease
MGSVDSSRGIGQNRGMAKTTKPRRSIEITVPIIPPSLKNSQRIMLGRNGRRWVQKSEKAEAACVAIRSLALRHARNSFGDRQVSLRLTVDEERKRTRIVLTDAGPKIPRRRDLHNVFDCVADGLQGILYLDDRQICMVSAEYGHVVEESDGRDNPGEE